MRRFVPIFLTLLAASLVAYLLWVSMRERALSTAETIGLLGIEAGILLAILSELGRRSADGNESLAGTLRLTRGTNARFGFSFLHPLAWDRFDPTSTEGDGFVHPKDPRIAVLGWCKQDVPPEPEQDPLHAEMEFRLATAKHRKGFRLLGKVPHEYSVTSRNAEGDSIVEENIEGWVLSYRTGRGARSTTYMEGFTYCDRDRVVYAISCQAPSHVFPKYEDVYIRMVDSLQVHRSHETRASKK